MSNRDVRLQIAYMLSLRTRSPLGRKAKGEKKYAQSEGRKLSRDKKRKRHTSATQWRDGIEKRISDSSILGPVEEGHRVEEEAIPR